MAEKPTQPKLAGSRHLPEQPVILVPGHHFFTAVAPLPAGTREKELAGLAALALEADSPFAEEQLARGHFAAAGGLVVFAMLRRKLAVMQEAWAKAAFVVPDFATWLARAEASGGVVLLETSEAVTALDFGAGSVLPRQIVSRPVAAEPGGEEGIVAAGEQVLAHLDSAQRRVRRFRLAETPCTVRGAKYEFHWVPQDSAAGHPEDGVALSTAQLWAMDLRDPAFLRVKRRDFQWNRYAWGALLGLGAAAVLLLVAEAALIGAQVANAGRQTRSEKQVPAARAAEANSDIIDRLAGYIDRKPQPLELLAYVNDVRPRSIYFTKVSVEGGLQMVVEGSTNVLAEINEFEAALKRMPALASVEVKNIRAREGGGTFQLSVTFRRDASLVPTPLVSRAPEPAPGERPPAMAPAPLPKQAADAIQAARVAETQRRQLAHGDPRAARPPAPSAATTGVPPSAPSDSLPPPPPPESGGADFPPPPPPS